MEFAKNKTVHKYEKRYSISYGICFSIICYSISPGWDKHLITLLHPANVQKKLREVAKLSLSALMVEGGWGYGMQSPNIPVEWRLQEAFFNLLYTKFRPCHRQMCTLLTHIPYWLLKKAQMGLQVVYFWR